MSRQVGEVLAALIDAVEAIKKRLDDPRAVVVSDLKALVADAMASLVIPSGEPGQPGRPPTATEIQNAVGIWMELNRELVKGPRGLRGLQGDAGPRGRDATDTQVYSAVQQWLAANADWDESDRAKVNPIVGQAGVAAGGGATTANTQRIVIASDQTAIPVSGAITASAQADGLASGTISLVDLVYGNGSTSGVAPTPNSYLEFALPAGTSGITIQLSGTFVGTVQFESSSDGTNFNARVYRSAGVLNNLQTQTSSFPSEWRGNGAAMRKIRVRCVARTSGTLDVAICTGIGDGAVFLNAAIPVGGQSVGNSTGSPSSPTAITLLTPYIGTGENVEHVAAIVLTYVCSQACTYRLQYSLDNSNWVDDEVYSVAAGVPFHTEYSPYAQYFRTRAEVVVTGTIYGKTLYRATPSNTSRASLSQEISAANKAQLTRAAITGLYDTPTAGTLGKFKTVPTNLLGYLFTVSQDFREDVALGRVPGHSLKHIISKTDLIGSNATEDVWNNGGTALIYPSSAAIASVVSTSLNDTAAGTGARTVRLYGLDSSYNEVTADVIMAGLVPVVTAQTFIRLHRIEILTAGSGGQAAGTITVTVSGNVQAQIDPNYTQSYNSHYTVPAGYSAVFARTVPTAGNGDELEVECVVRDTTVANSVFKPVKNFILFGNGVTQESPVSQKFTEKMDIKFRAMNYTSGSNRKCHVDYFLLIVQNSLVN